MQEVEGVCDWSLGQMMQQVIHFSLLPFQFKGYILRDWILLELCLFYPGWYLKSILSNTDVDFLFLGHGGALPG